MLSATMFGSYTYGPCNLIATRGGAPYLWDTYGQLVSDGMSSRQFTWSRAGELVAESDAGRYGYDAAGWRVKRQVGTGAATYYVYDSDQRLMLRWRSGGG